LLNISLEITIDKVRQGVSTILTTKIAEVDLAICGKQLKRLVRAAGIEPETH